MPLLFSYGSLRRADVQRATFGRLLEGTQDALVAFELVPPAPGVSPHANVVRSTSISRVAGMAFEITDAELASADEYERRDGYVRVMATLASGKTTWLYVDAKSLERSKINGSCHCGNIAFALDWPGDAAEVPARSCGCTFCVKHGGVWASNPQATLTVKVKDGAAVSKYEFGTKTATFMVCGRCGAAPLVTSEIEGKTYAVVNVNSFDDFDRARIRAAGASFDGEDVAARLARRARNWIADVRFELGK